MKKTFTIIGLCLTTIFIGCKTKELTAEQQIKAKEYAEKIEVRNFTFYANTAQPTGEPSVNLNYNYSLKVSKDTIVAYLPYYGRSYVAPISPININIDFVSTDFLYTESKNKNGSYEIKIIPKDITNRENEGIVLILKISPSGYGTLNALLTNRKTISFYGVVE